MKTRLLKSFFLAGLLVPPALVQAQDDLNLQSEALLLSQDQLMARISVYNSIVTLLNVSHGTWVRGRYEVEWSQKVMAVVGTAAAVDGLTLLKKGGPFRNLRKGGLFALLVAVGSSAFYHQYSKDILSFAETDMLEMIDELGTEVEMLEFLGAEVNAYREGLRMPPFEFNLHKLDIEKFEEIMNLRAPHFEAHKVP